MTLAKTCHASNMVQDLVKSTHRPIATTKAFWVVEWCFSCSIIVLKDKISYRRETARQLRISI